ncbi:transmembrane protein, putative [Bodo saltans]|uniref:Transmembrane protein, putative n=1 Tax=Bodo saltans TaxID=75058 RepID=A0A0S4ITM2_BODSA|nr:transmembrane protein, putative [Bodo saltans]|eukprot:CUF09787.1 transmembrane protein, putative [Bodo saltans]
MNLLAGTTIAFASNLEHSTNEALRLFVHGAWAPEEVNLLRCLRHVDDIVKATTGTHNNNNSCSESEVEAMLAGLSAALMEGTDVLPSDTPWKRRWLNALRLDAKRPKTPPTPYGSPRRNIEMNIAVHFGSPVRADQSGSMNEATPEEAVALRVALAQIVLLRHLAFAHLREMEAMHLEIQHYLSYWRWGLEHPRRCCWHQLISGRRHVWAGLWNGMLRFAVHATTRETIAKVTDLQGMEVYVVKSIGRIYNAIEGLRHAVETATLDEPEVADVLAVLQGAVTRAVHAMTRRSYRTCGNHLAGHGSHGSFYHNNANKIPHVESAIIGDEDHTPETNIPSLWAQKQTQRIAALAKEQFAWMGSWRAALRTHMAPPIGRYWSGVVLVMCVLIPSCRLLITTSMDDAQHAGRRVRSACEYIFRWYVKGPAENLYQSLYSSREGVEDRRAKLRNDIESMAKMIEDYHEDYYDEGSISHGELEDIRRNAIEGDYGLISRHLEQAIRHPIKGFFFGNLVRLTLIQVQHLKLDVARVLASFDEVLEANDVNFRMMALGPLVLLSVGIVSYSVFRKKKKRRPALAKMRMLWRSLHRLITFARADEEDGEHEELRFTTDRNGGGGNLAPSSTNSFLDEEQQGRVVLTVHHLRLLREFLQGYQFVEAFLEDLDDLEAASSTRHQRLRTLDRMMGTHFFLAPRDD